MMNKALLKPIECYLTSNQSITLFIIGLTNYKLINKWRVVRMFL